MSICARTKRGACRWADFGVGIGGCVECIRGGTRRGGTVQLLSLLSCRGAVVETAVVVFPWGELARVSCLLLALVCF